jgi:hypothetical protein
MQQESQIHEHPHEANVIRLPAPTVWPMVLALGLSLIITGMVTHWVVSLLGLLLTLRSMVGWFFEMFPHEKHISVPVQVGVLKIESTRRTREQLPIDAIHRKMLPIETFSVTAGIRGGIVGGVAMILPAALFGLLRYHSIWYPANLLAAGGFVSWAGESDQFFAQFHLQGLLAAIGIHALASVLIGLLYGAMLPMFPRTPILTAGFIAPFMWTGLLYSALNIISPVLAARIDWPWFIVSQIAFGLVCGFVVNLQVKVRTSQFRALPFSVRAGLEMDLPTQKAAEPIETRQKDESQ